MPILGIMASSILKVTSSYESIASFSSTGIETTCTFSSISSAYKHLQIRGLFARNLGGQIDIALTFNGDTASNYSFHVINGDGSTATANASASTSYIAAGVAPGATVANTFGASIIDVYDYASATKNKTVRSFGGADTNNVGLSANRLWSGAWYNTAAITSITISTFGDVMNTGTTFSLYGIKG